MNEIEQIPINFEKEITEADLSNISEANRNEVAWGIFKTVLQFVPSGIGAAIAQGTEGLMRWQHNSFIRKLGMYLFGIKNLDVEQRHFFLNEVSIAVDDHGGAVLFDTLQRLDNWNKAAILANLTLARVNGDISIEDFFRAASALEKVPYVDLKYLERYVDDYYDPMQPQ